MFQQPVNTWGGSRLVDAVLGSASWGTGAFSFNGLVNLLWGRPSVAEFGQMNFDARPYTGIRLTFSEVTAPTQYFVSLMRNAGSPPPELYFTGTLSPGAQVLDLDFSNPSFNTMGTREDVDQISIFLDGQGTLTRVEMVPEPATMTAMGLGLAALLRRRLTR